MNSDTFDNIIGKIILVGITVKDDQDNVLHKTQYAGEIIDASKKDGIMIQDKEGTVRSIPPVLSNIRKAMPGTYKLDETKEEIHNPDFLTNWIIRDNKKNVH